MFAKRVTSVTHLLDLVGVLFEKYMDKLWPSIGGVCKATLFYILVMTHRCYCQKNTEKVNMSLFTCL